MEVKFLHFNRSNKTSTPADGGDKLYINTVIPRATNKKFIQIYT